MAETTEVRNEPVAESKTPATASAPEARPGGTLANIIFWAYERGSKPYDLFVILILAFIFLTPRSWFDDRPTLQLTDLRNHQGIVEVSHSRKGGSYLVDARLVDSKAPQKLEDAVRDILRSRVDRPFTVKSIEASRDRNQILLGYTVVVEFQ